MMLCMRLPHFVDGRHKPFKFYRLKQVIGYIQFVSFERVLMIGACDDNGLWIGKRFQECHSFELRQMDIEKNKIRSIISQKINSKQSIFKSMLKLEKRNLRNIIRNNTHCQWFVFN